MIIAPAISGKPRTDPLSHALDGPKPSGAASHLGRGNSMSSKAMAWASRQKTSNKLAKLTLILMCDRHDLETNVCTFLIEGVANEVQVSPEKIFSHLKSLEKDGLITPWVGARRSEYARFFLNIDGSRRKLSK